MMFLRFFIFSLFFLFISFQAMSLPCQESFSSGSVFVNYAKEQIGESWSVVMGSKWEERIVHATRGWRRENTRDFLEFLTGCIGKEVVSYVESYIGVKSTKETMRENLQGFSTANLSKLLISS